MLRGRMFLRWNMLNRRAREVLRTAARRVCCNSESKDILQCYGSLATSIMQEKINFVETLGIFFRCCRKLELTSYKMVYNSNYFY